MDNDAFLRSIPSFLRRPQEPWPDQPMFRTGSRVGAQSDSDVAAPEVRPQSVPPRSEGARDGDPGSAPGRRATRLPWRIPRRASAMARPVNPAARPGAEESRGGAPAGPAPEVVRLAAHPGAGARAAVRTAGATLDPAVAAAAASGDAPFQVALPRVVVRQIRLIAAKEGTSERAVVLGALRAAGLAVPRDAERARPAPAAQRRRQA